MRKFLLGTALACTTLIALVSPATADEPGWGYQRDMTCDGQSVLAHVTPGGVFTTFHVDGTTDVIIAKHLEILGYFDDGTWAVTRHVPGFATNGTAKVQCSYVDRAGYQIRFDGVRR